jgi:putative DNA primase/helicase
MLARTIGNIGTIQHNIDVFRDAALRYFGIARHADQYGTLLAGAYSLMSDCKIKEETAYRFICGFDWDSYTEDTESDDAAQCLSSILQIQLRVEGEQGPRMKSIGEWIVNVRQRPLGWKDVDESLRRIGIKCLDKEVVIANNSDYLSVALRQHEWGVNWNRYIRRSSGVGGNMPTATKNPITFCPGVFGRGTIVPYCIMNLEEESHAD